MLQNVEGRDTRTSAICGLGIRVLQPNDTYLGEAACGENWLKKNASSCILKVRVISDNRGMLLDGHRVDTTLTSGDWWWICRTLPPSDTSKQAPFAVELANRTPVAAC